MFTNCQRNIGSAYELEAFIAKHVIKGVGALVRLPLTLISSEPFLGRRKDLEPTVRGEERDETAGLYESLVSAESSKERIGLGEEVREQDGVEAAKIGRQSACVGLFETHTVAIVAGSIEASSLRPSVPSSLRK